MKKYSSREKLLFRLILAVLVFAVVQESWIRHGEAVTRMQNEIDSEHEHQGLLLEKIDVDQDRLEREIKGFNSILEESHEKVLRMPNESEAIFKVQEMLSKLGEDAEINMNSQNKRKSRVISEETGLLEIRTYFGYDCQLENLLNFFDLLKDTPYYTAIDTLNINSYSRRRSRSRKNETKTPNRDKIRGSVVISTLFLAGEADGAPKDVTALIDATPSAKKVVPPEAKVVEKVETTGEVQVEKDTPSVAKNETKLSQPEEKAQQPIPEVKRKETSVPSNHSKVQAPRNLAPIPKPLTHTTQPKKK